MTFRHIHPFLTLDAEDTYRISDVSALTEELVYFFTLVFFISSAVNQNTSFLPFVL